MFISQADSYKIPHLRQADDVGCNFADTALTLKVQEMTIQEICDYFKNEVYSAHPEYEIEHNVIDNSSYFYLKVHLGNGNCYCFLILPEANNQPDNRIKLSKKDLKEFEQLYNSPKCILKKVIIIKRKAANVLEHRTFAPEYFEKD
jgi:hypothetical protein